MAPVSDRPRRARWWTFFCTDRFFYLLNTFLSESLHRRDVVHEMYKVLLKIENRIVGNKRNEIPSFKRLAEPIIIHKMYANKNKMSVTWRFCLTCRNISPLDVILNCDHRSSLGGAFGRWKSEELFFCQFVSVDPELLACRGFVCAKCFVGRTMGIMKKAINTKHSIPQFTFLRPTFISWTIGVVVNTIHSIFPVIHMSVLMPRLVGGTIGVVKGIPQKV